MSLLPLDDRDGVIWTNGKLVPWRDAKVHVLSHSLHYGNAVFEGERCYGGKVFKLREHTQRLLDSAKLVAMKLPYSLDEIVAATELVVKENALDLGYIRPIAYRGAEAIGVSAKGTKVHLAVAAFEWPAYYGGSSIALQTSRWKRLVFTSVLAPRHFGTGVAGISNVFPLPAVQLTRNSISSASGGSDLSLSAIGRSSVACHFSSA